MIRSLVTLLVCLFGAVALLVSAPAGSSSISDQARKLHFSSIVVGYSRRHHAAPLLQGFRSWNAQRYGHIDIPRMREGGLSAIFFSIWIDGRTMGPPAIQKALDQIDAVQQNVRKNSKDLAFARTADDVRRAHKEKKDRCR